jgi:aldehyde:ferredoxin oxidoreductase
MAGKAVGGYMGKILRVDLSTEHISEESPDEATFRGYIGGTGLGVKYLYEEVPPGVEWSNPENRIMFMAGPLSGTRLSGSGIFSIISKGPMTNLAGTTQANGYFSAFLKFSGFDGIVVQGKAKRWLYLYIHNGTAELRDAAHLQGKDTWETEDAIKKEINKPCSVFTIGPAGENLVRFASIVGDHGHVAAHNGLGAVMGSKKLKAIVAERGNRKVSVARRDDLGGLVDALVDGSRKAMPTLSSLGTAGALPMMHQTGQLPVKNYTTSIFPEYEKFSGEYLRTHFKSTPTTCWACRISHCRQTEVTEGPYKGFVGEEPEYEGVAAMSSVIGQTDPGATVVLGNDVDRLGLDINESGWLVGWLMECSQKGLLKKGDLDGLDIKWGDAEATRAILKKTAYREGNGNLWAEGVKRTAEKYGGEALDCAVYTLKGATPRGHDHRARWSEMIDTCLSNTGTIEVGPGMPAIPELGIMPPKDPFDAIEVSTFNAVSCGRRLFEDSLVICFFCGQDLKMLTDTLSVVTGRDFDIKEVMTVGKRIVNQLRVFNIRHGLTKAVEAPSVRYGSTPIDGPAAGKSIMPQWEALRRNYYEKIGWDPETGIPLPETLTRVGLAQLIPDLMKTDKGGG